MRELLFCLLIPSTVALFFPTSSGGGGCCCGCGTPQPASCGCQPSCPPPQACPACPAPPSCPPPPAAYCPQVQPIYVPSCAGPTCGCSGGSCGLSGGYVGSGCSGSSCGGGGYATAGNGGYATSGGYASGGGGGYAAPRVAPASGYASTGGGGYSAPIAAPISAQEAGYGGGGGGGYQENVAAADDPNTSQENQSAQGPVPPATLPPLNQAFKSPQICEPGKIKYIVLRKRVGQSGDELEEEAEEIDRPTPLEATASPLDNKEIRDELLHGDEELGDADGGIQARGAPTLTDAKCNSKDLRDLIMENIVRDDALASKRQIHETSIKRFPEHTVDVICSTTGFTYLVSTTEHCEAQRDNVICFVYKRPI